MTKTQELENTITELEKRIVILEENLMNAIMGRNPSHLYGSGSVAYMPSGSNTPIIGCPYCGLQYDARYSHICSGLGQQSAINPIPNYQQGSLTAQAQTLNLPPNYIYCTSCGGSHSKGIHCPYSGGLKNP